MASGFSSEEVEFAVADKSVPWERGITTGSTNAASEIGRDDDLDDDYYDDYQTPTFGFIPNDYQVPERSSDFVPNPNDYEVPERSFGFVSLAAPKKSVRTTPLSMVQEDDDDFEIPLRSCGFRPEASKMRSPPAQDPDYKLPQRTWGIIPTDPDYKLPQRTWGIIPTVTQPYQIYVLDVDA
ncbi:unnamed protein product [Polarella glacialis]|uniref:Uncharacterized protein n=1 Tax=Polarella glacialis TaxID=89957 RepID=A0A813JX38_POLGL|nr:unnamed protein product [Polarella glacialis]